MGLFYLCLPLCQYGFHSNMSSSQVYAIFRDAVNKTGRPIYLDIRPHAIADGIGTEVGERRTPLLRDVRQVVWLRYSSPIRWLRMRGGN